MTDLYHVLIVEDDEPHVELMRTHFAAHFPEAVVDEASTGEQCYEKLAARRFDLLLLDNRLPGETGLEVLGQLASRGLNHLPVIVFTGFADADGAAAALRQGAYDYVHKTVESLQYIPLLARRAIERYRIEREHSLLRQQLVDTNSRLAAVQTELARALERSGELNLMKSRFLATIGHEVRAPLHAMLGYTSLIRDGLHGEINPRQVESLDRISRRGQDLLHTLNGVLELSRLQARQCPLRVSRFDIARIVDEVEETVQPQADSKGLRLVCDVSQGLAIVSDRDKASSVLLNLVTNALKYTETGTITVAAKACPDRTGVLLEVRDTGVGIPAAELGGIFDPFRQGETAIARPMGGVGLGLSLVKELLDVLGGSVEVDSTIGPGSVFRVFLPMSPPATASVAPLHRAVPPPADAPVVLAIEDDESAIALYESFLDAEGIAMVSATTGLAGLEKAERLRPEAIVLDIWLPDMRGWQVLSTLKKQPGCRDIPVLVVSAVDEPDYARSLGAHCSLPKPVSRSTFMRALKQALSPA